VQKKKCLYIGRAKKKSVVQKKFFALKVIY
jgi:hypothetical protein